MLRKLKRAQQRKYAVAVATLATWISLSTLGYSAPSGGEIFTGSGTISQSGTVTTINQGSNKLGINWQDFNIAAGEKVQFIQPGSSSIALNRVVGNNGSAIYGQLTANGQIFLINPNGVLFGSGAKVNVGGLVASTKDISNADFASGNYSFAGDGGSVLNEGELKANSGGYIALLGSNVENDGVIIANQGTVALASGQKVTLDFTGDGLINVVVDKNALQAVVVNHQLIQADDGRVIMTAKTADALGSVVNSGIITARNLQHVNGMIELSGDATTNSGLLDVAGQTGGTVKVLGTKVTLTETSKINASGTSGGGTVLIGGNFQGKGTEQNAQATSVAAGATINADATTAGNGGQVAVWSDGTTDYQGSITAQGGKLGGDGGSVEVSGQTSLKFSGKVDLRALQGKTGTLLLDPQDYLIAATGGDMTGAALSDLLDTANVTILSSNGSSDGTGDVTVNDAVSWDTGNTLTLSAFHDVNVNNTITNNSSMGSLVLRADNTGTGTGTVNFAGYVGTGPAINVNNIKIYYNPDSSDTAAYGYNGGNSSNNGGSNPYSGYSATGNTMTAYMLVNNLNQLQAMNSNLNGIYALGRDIDVSATNSGSGFAPIGTGGGDDSLAFNGIFNGDGHVIDQLTINNDSLGYAGLFGGTGSTAQISNVGLTNVNIQDHGATALVGGIVGENKGSITGSYVTGNVTGGANNTGGLAGNNYGAITGSHSDAAVSGTGAIGGIAGGNFGSISASYNTGSVTGDSPTAVGGLAGHLEGSIAASYNTGSVSSTGDTVDGGHAGGLAGQGNGSITNSYNTGSVTITGNTDGNRGGGGIAGAMWGGSITNCYTTGSVTAGGTGVSSGGLLGLPWGVSVTNSYWDKETSGKENSDAYWTVDAATYGLSDAAMKTAASFAGWESPWVLQDGAYPTLASSADNNNPGGGVSPGGNTPGGGTISTEQSNRLKNIIASVSGPDKENDRGNTERNGVGGVANIPNSAYQDQLITVNLDNSQAQDDTAKEDASPVK